MLAFLFNQIDDPADGPMNMGLDQAIAESVDRGETSSVCLRLYCWKQPTLSLGYFQEHQSRQGHVASSTLPFVRRNSGGGAIIHDQELTYSLSMLSNKAYRGADRDVYLKVHQAIRSAISDLSGIKLVRFADSGLKPLFDDKTFLCFERRTDEDLLLSGYKIVGSAQRRVGGALLQHGSILLQTSRFAPSLPGLSCLSGCGVDKRILGEMLCEHIGKSLAVKLVATQVSPSTLTRAEHWAQERFANQSWNFRR
ncbi:MAG: biotin/lipoate A/B protein ligase family protein [Pirellulaceae bacterium]